MNGLKSVVVAVGCQNSMQVGKKNYSAAGEAVGLRFLLIASQVNCRLLLLLLLSARRPTKELMTIPLLST